MITLANGSQTIAKGIGLACPLPFLPLTFIPYVLNSPFNPISISKLTRDFNCLITFFDNSITLQDRSTRRTIDIGCESQGLFRLSSLSSSIVKSHRHSTPRLQSSRSSEPFQVSEDGFSFFLLSSLMCESHQLGKNTSVPSPKRLDH